MDDLTGFDSEPLPDWQPVSDDDASRLLRRLRGVKADMAAAQALYDAERERLDSWLADRTGGAARAAAGYERALEGWARRACLETGRRTFDLPNGVLRLRAWSLHYSGTPVGEPGRYRIVGWGRKIPCHECMGGYEYDGGVKLVDEETEAESV